jgi:uncharacterized protein (TIGR00251 family)
MNHPAVEWHDNTLRLTIHLQPRASRDEVKGIQGDAIRIRITAPPVEGKANEHLLRFLARQFGVARRQVELLSGDSHRRKRVQIQTPVTWPDWLPAVKRLED